MSYLCSRNHAHLFTIVGFTSIFGREYTTISLLSLNATFSILFLNHHSCSHPIFHSAKSGSERKDNCSCTFPFPLFYALLSLPCALTPFSLPSTPSPLYSSRRSLIPLSFDTIVQNVNY